MSTLYLRLAGILLLFSIGVGSYLYVTGLRNKVTGLEEQVVSLTKAKLEVESKLQEATTSRQALEEKMAQAQTSISAAEAKLKQQKVSIRYVKVPDECPAAIDWLLQEVTK